MNSRRLDQQKTANSEILTMAVQTQIVSGPPTRVKRVFLMAESGSDISRSSISYGSDTSLIPASNAHDRDRLRPSNSSHI